MELIVRPIGHVRSPFLEKAEAPRQAVLAKDVRGSIEVFPEYVDALSDLEGFERIWLLFWFDRAEGWSSTVLPPRSETKRGVFATRSPHRPNPIGMSVVRLERVEGRILFIRDLDLIDGTPILDIKPYIPYADAFPESNGGWLDNPSESSRRSWAVRFEPDAEEALAWIHAETGVDLKTRISASLGIGPQPHAYRRIRETANGSVLAVKEWRARFRADASEQTIVVDAIDTGYRERDLAEGQTPLHVLHRAFVARLKS